MALPPALESEHGGGRRSRHPFLALSLVALAVMIGVVLVTGTGVDVLIIVALLAGLFVVERFVSDWFADVLGPRLGLGLLAALLIGFGIWGTTTAPEPVRDFVSSPLGSLVRRAEGYGYTGAFVGGRSRPVLSPARVGPAPGPGRGPPRARAPAAEHRVGQRSARALPVGAWVRRLARQRVGPRTSP